MGRKAARLGLSPGTSLADARARIPDLAVVEHDPAADEALLLRLTEDSARWTPLVAPDPPDGLLLDITGCAHLFGGEEALRRRSLARFGKAGLTARGAIADTPDAARALARFGPGGSIAPDALADAIGRLPVAALELPTRDGAALRHAGLRRIRDVAAIAPASLAARFGEGMPRRLARLLGQEDRRITPHRPPSACRAELPFDTPVCGVQAVERALERLLGRVCLLLAERDQGGRGFEAVFFRTDGVARRVAVATARPSRSPAGLLRLFREALGALAEPIDTGLGFDLIRLSVPEVEPLGPAQETLDGRQAEADDGVNDLLDRLVARLGPHRVLRFVAEDTHDPVRGSRLLPATEAAGGGTWTVPDPGEPPMRPLRLFDPPQPVDTLAEVPDGPPLRFRWRRVVHDVARSEGPERIAAEWWRHEAGATRDYYRVEDRTGRRFWLFRSGLHGAGDAPPRWYLHGLFA